MDRIEICEVYHLIEIHYSCGGLLYERPSNKRRNMSTDFQLKRMGFKPSPLLKFSKLSDQQLILYFQLLDKWGLEKNVCMLLADYWLSENFDVKMEYDYPFFFDSESPNEYKCVFESDYTLDYLKLAEHYAAKLLIDFTVDYRMIGNFLYKYNPTKTITTHKGVFCAIEHGMFDMKLYKIT